MVIHIQATSLIMASPFTEAETNQGPGLGDSADFDEDEPGL